MIEVPEELGELNEDQLRDLATQIEAAADEYREIGLENLTDEQLMEVERLAADYDRVSEELSSQEQTAADRQARANEALSKIGGGSNDEVDGSDTVEASLDATATFSDEGDESEGDEPEGESADEVEESETEDEGDESESEDEDGDEDETSDAGDEDPEEPEASAEEDEGEAGADDGADETVSDTEELNVDEEITTATDSAVERLSNARPGSAAPEESEADGRVLVMARATENATALGVGRDEELDLSALSELVVRKHRQMTRLGGAPHEPIVLATAKTLFDDDQMLGTSAEDNYAVLEGLKRKARKSVV